ncbi:MAG: Ig-like domain-containing protein [Chloroflexota bacterium]
MRADRLLLATVVALALLAGGLSVASAKLGPGVDSLTTIPMFDGTSVNTEIGLTFTEPMLKQPTERSVSFKPNIAASFNWVGNELMFLPKSPLRYHTRYTVTVGVSARDTQGRSFFRPYHSSFTTQSRHLIYQGTAGNQRSRLVVASLDGKRQIVGNPNVGDYSLSFDRSLVVYSRRPAHGKPADEIWILSLADGSTQRIFAHRGWQISEPHFSPDGQYVVFLATNVRICQKFYGCFVDTTSPVVYLYSLRSHQVRPFHAGNDVPISNFITFSPAGQIAYTDLGSALTLADPNGSNLVHVPNQGNSLVFSAFDASGNEAAFVGQTASSIGGDVLVFVHSKYVDVSKGVYDSDAPAFATSGKRIAYAGYHGEKGIEPLYSINVYDFASRHTRRLALSSTLSDWSPTWSTDDRYVALVRSRPQEAMYMGSGQIWIMRSDGSGLRRLGGIGSDPRWL